MVGQGFEVCAGHGFVGGYGADPAWYHHPDVHGDAEDRTPFCKAADVLIGELARVVYLGAAIVVASPDRALEEIQCVVEVLVAEVGGVQDHAEPIHFFDEFLAHIAQRAGLIMPECVAADPVVGRAECAEALGVGSFEVGKGT